MGRKALRRILISIEIDRMQNDWSSGSIRPWWFSMICIGLGGLAIVLCTKRVDRHSHADLVITEVGTKASVHMLSTMLLTFHFRFGRVPSSLEELHSMLSEAGEPWPRILEDEWGRALVLKISKENSQSLGSNVDTNIQIISFGADGLVGGQGADQDITANVRIINGTAVGDL